eukprot:g5844.t1
MEWFFAALLRLLAIRFAKDEEEKSPLSTVEFTSEAQCYNLHLASLTLEASLLMEGCVSVEEKQADDLKRQNLAVREADNAAARQRRLQTAEEQNKERQTRYQERKDGKNEERRARYQEMKDGKNEERRARYHEMKDNKNEERRALYHSDPEIQEIKNARRRARQTGRNHLYKIACAHVTTFDENGTMLFVRHGDHKLGTPFDSPNQRCPFCGAWFWNHELNPNLRANQQFTDRMAATHYWSCCSNGQQSTSGKPKTAYLLKLDTYGRHIAEFPS